MEMIIQITVKSQVGEPERIQEVARLERGTLRPDNLGLSLAEARSILAGLEQTMAQRQAAEFAAQACRCPQCGRERACKGHHPIVFRTPFGKLRLDSPRLYRCGCESNEGHSFSPLAELLPERTSPELVYLETKFAALMSYGLTVKLLEEVLPIDQALSPTAVRHQVQRAAQLRLTRMSRLTKGVKEAEQPDLSADLEEMLEHLKWNLWHGKVDRALEITDELIYALDLENGSPEHRKLLKAVRAFGTYVTNNRTFIPDSYGERYRQGKIISTAFVESAVNQVVSKRFVKKQQMRWTEAGAHLLLQIRAEVLNGDWRATLSRWYPGMQLTPEPKAA